MVGCKMEVPPVGNAGNGKGKQEGKKERIGKRGVIDCKQSVH